MKPPVNWVAELAHVREVSLFGTADLAFWKDRLRQRALVPAEGDGRAQILIIASESTFWGVLFRELIFSVLCRRAEGTLQDASYLMGAFISQRLFAFCERALFSTPYSYGDVCLSVSVPASIRLVGDGDVVFRAEMGVDTTEREREPSQRGESGWQGTVFLPESGRGKRRQGNVFFVKIRGHTQTYPFLPGVDFLTIAPSPDTHVLQELIDSRFVATEWVIREDATHARSKTYTQGDVNRGAGAPGS
jgi:hypothetical protein